MSKLRNDLYQRFNGFKPVKNAKGEWYYIDPRYESNDPRSRIKVANENSPNPKINEILEDDMNNNPEDYYIWHTKGDDKVRSSHAARDGKIFNYNVPPEGGNPGEDYNCRCWAEPYRPNKNKQSAPAKVDLSGLPQYEDNISDDELLERMANNLLNTEKMKDYIYLDRYGHITSGVGALLDSEQIFKSVPWIINGRPATKQEVDDAYKKFTVKRFEKDNNGKYINHNKIAEAFEKECNLRVPKDYMMQRMKKHIKNDLIRAKLKIKDFETYPTPLKLIILDFYYNKGSFYNQPGLPQALDARNAKLFQEKMLRNMKDRDEWTKEQFSQIPQNFWGLP